MTTEVLNRPPVTDGSGSDTTDHPPIETTFPGADDDESARRQAQEDVASLEGISQATEQAEEARTERRLVVAGRGYSFEHVGGGLVQPSKIAGPAVAQFFRQHHELTRTVWTGRTRDVLGSIAGKANFRLN